MIAAVSLSHEIKIVARCHGEAVIQVSQAALLTSVLTQYHAEGRRKTVVMIGQPDWTRIAIVQRTTDSFGIIDAFTENDKAWDLSTAGGLADWIEQRLGVQPGDCVETQLKVCTRDA